MHIPGWFLKLAPFALACGLALGAEPPEPAYRGGALVVTDPALAQGHLAPGQALPIRLARLAPPERPGLPPLQGTEVAGSVRYGSLVFQRVSPLAVSFLVVLAGAPARSVTLRQGEGADLDGDGLDDVVLQAPAQPLQTRAAAVDYALLAFTCDAAHTSMFALAPGACAGGRYPYGISGATPSGQFIFQSDCLTLEPEGAPRAAVASFTGGQGPEVRPGPGDVLVDARSGQFGRIARVDQHGRRMDIHLAAAGTPRQFQEIFGAAQVRLSGSLADLARRYRPRGARAPQATLDLLDSDSTVTLLQGPGGRLDLQVAARVSVTVDLTGSVNFYGITVQQSACLDETLRLAAEYRADRPWVQQFSPFPVASLQVGFAVGGVPMSFGLDLSAGLDLDDQVTGTALQGFRSRGRWGWSSSFAATWGWRGVEVNAPDPVLTHEVTLEALPEGRSDLRGTASLRPWVTLTPRLGFAACLYGKLPCTVDATWSVRLDGAAPVRERLDTRCALAAGLSLDLPVLGPLWQHTWPLETWTRTVLMPAAATAP